MKQLGLLMLVSLFGLFCSSLQAGGQRAVVPTVPAVEQPAIIGLELVAESPPDENGRQVLITRMEVDGVAYPLYFVKDEGQEYEPNTEVMLGKTFGVIPSEDDIARYFQDGGELDIFGLEALATVHDQVSIQVHPSGEYMIIALWNRGVIVSAYVSANYNLVLESANQLFPFSNTNGQGYSEIQLTPEQKKAIACDILWRACTGPAGDDVIPGCTGWLAHCQGT